MDWNKYIDRINIDGSSKRERDANRFKRQIINKSSDSISYKTVKINGVESHLVIDSGTKPYYKQFKSLPGQEINIGDYVEWANNHWLVVDCDSDDELYRDGTLNQCNYLLKWQNETGEIIERWAVIMSASKYNDGTEDGKVISIGSDQLSVVIPVDSESIKLKKSMGKKFFIDNNSSDPSVYELTGTGNVSDTFNGYGVTSWIVKECRYTATEDDLLHGVCDYFSPTVPPIPPDETVILNAKIKGVPEIKFGKTKSFTVEFTNDNGEIVNDCVFAWNVISGFNVEHTEDGNTIKINVTDESSIEDSFLLQIIVDGNVLAQTDIRVVPLF